MLALQMYNFLYFDQKWIIKHQIPNNAKKKILIWRPSNETTQLHRKMKETAIRKNSTRTHDKQNRGASNRRFISQREWQGAAASKSGISIFD